MMFTEVYIKLHNDKQQEDVEQQRNVDNDGDSSPCSSSCSQASGRSQMGHPDDESICTSFFSARESRWTNGSSTNWINMSSAEKICQEKEGLCTYSPWPVYSQGGGH